MSVVEVRDLSVAVGPEARLIVNAVSLDVEKGKILGIVGESGSGKTTVGTALLGYFRRGARLVGGEVRVEGQDVLAATPRVLRSLRGQIIAYIPQDPAAALNPALRLGRQLNEALAAHGAAGEWRGRVAEVLDEVGLPTDAAFLRRYPHQVSGGQQQRLAIAIAFSCRPAVVVCDEPTTGLDVTTQARVLATLTTLCDTHGVGAVYISHDLGVVGNLADDMLVMYAGQALETGRKGDVFQRPAHPYTRGLLRAVPSASRRHALEPIPGQAPGLSGGVEGCVFAPRCAFARRPTCTATVPKMEAVGGNHRARCVRLKEIGGNEVGRDGGVPRKRAPGSSSLLMVRNLAVHYGAQQALYSVSLSVNSGECVAVVGESGSGKTTLARSIVGLVPVTSGHVEFMGTVQASDPRNRLREAQKGMQYVFQNPYGSLNPRRTIGDIVAAPIRHFYKGSRIAALEMARDALHRVSLSDRVLYQYPDRLSGGERQRVAIARALVCRPAVLICDEITSALDVSVQAAIVRLLEQLRADDGLSLVFVTHNLPLVRNFADRVAVLKDGRIVEMGSCESVLDTPSHEYTKLLLADTAEGSSWMP